MGRAKWKKKKKKKKKKKRLQTRASKTHISLSIRANRSGTSVTDKECYELVTCVLATLEMVCEVTTFATKDEGQATVSSLNSLPYLFLTSNKTILLHAPMPNSIELDQTPRTVASDLGRHWIRM